MKKKSIDLFTPSNKLDRFSSCYNIFFDGDQFIERKAYYTLHNVSRNKQFSDLYEMTKYWEKVYDRNGNFKSKKKGEGSHDLQF